MRIEARIEEGYSHAAAAKAFVSLHSQRRRQHEIILLKNGGVRLDLSLRAGKYLDAAAADVCGFSGRGIRSNYRVQVFLKGVDRMKIAFTITTADGTDRQTNRRCGSWLIDDFRLAHVVLKLGTACRDARAPQARMPALL